MPIRRLLPLVLIPALAASAHALDQPKTEASPAEKASLPHHLSGKINGELLSINILPQDAMRGMAKLKGTQMLNIEPGCLMVEAWCELIGDNRFSIRMPHDDFFTKHAIDQMGAKSKDVILEFQPSTSPTTAAKITTITTITAAPAPAPAPEAETETEKAKPGSEKKPAPAAAPQPPPK
ncbi:hypothetical protein OKA05_27880 [Luteolibacter arcticus]|uniref:Uncharacterized protein n=1 Tax=Luteolibacter arcticus TaxID=1581411 RepID=A0ABT3GSF9_9BACT|nr:hypothetical protein [Luteolibacter arcticus]MCW1926403.1 hypothetical protein [Luteolibacter arcticus]